MANSADPDQLASSEANWPGSTLFAKAGYSKTRVKIHANKSSMIRVCTVYYSTMYFKKQLHKKGKI